MAIRKQDADKSQYAVVKDQHGNVTKTVDLNDRQVGAAGNPKNLSVTGDIILTGDMLASDESVYLRVGAGLSAITQSNAQVFLSTPRVCLPTEVSGCLLWLEANANYVVLDTSNTPSRVTTWLDLSGNGNHLTQATSARQPRWFSANPAYKDVYGNALPSLEFLSAQTLTLSSLTLTSFTVILVLQTKNTTGIVYEHSPNCNSNDGSWIFCSVNASGGPSFLTRRSSLNTSKDMPYGASWATQNANPVILTHTFNGVHASHRMAIGNWDVSLTADASTNNLGTPSLAQSFNLGGRQDVSTAMSGSIVACAVYSPVLTSGQAARVARYFGDKFGVVAL